MDLYSTYVSGVKIATNVHPKGQLISKGLFAILEFFQKANETIQSKNCLAKKSNSFVRFLEELLA